MTLDRHLATAGYMVTVVVDVGLAVYDLGGFGRVPWPTFGVLCLVLFALNDVINAPRPGWTRFLLIKRDRTVVAAQWPNDGTGDVELGRPTIRELWNARGTDGSPLRPSWYRSLIAPRRRSSEPSWR